MDTRDQTLSLPMRKFPRADLRVSPLCLGTMTFGTPVEAADAARLCDWAIDHGINFIDTANSYEGYSRTVGSPGGRAEEIVGEALRGRRDKVLVATKVGMKIGPAADDEGLSRAHILREVERSLRRLRTDYIDLYYLHKPDPGTALAETVETVHELVSSGRIRYWGLSNFTATQTAELLGLCDTRGWHRPVAVQPAYSLLKRDIELELMPLCSREGLAIIPYQVLQGGLLTGKYRSGEPMPAGSRFAERPEWLMPMTDAVLSQLDSIERDADTLGRGLLEHALVELLDRPGVVSLIVGAKRPQQLADLIAAIDHE